MTKMSIEAGARILWTAASWAQRLAAQPGSCTLTIDLPLFLVLAMFATPVSGGDDSPSPGTRIVEVFRRHAALVTQGPQGAGEAAHHEWRAKVEHEHEREYVPSVRKAKRIVCRNGDAALLKAFIDTELADSGSADEEPSFLLGEMFMCKPELVLAVVGRLSRQDRVSICNDLRWGFANVMYGHKKPPGNASLVKKLKATCNEPS